MPANPDYSDLFRILNEEAVEYLVIGAHAVMYYTVPRYTRDLDIWIKPVPENAKKLWRALETFGAPLRDLSLEDFCDQDCIYQIGVEPNRIDIIMGNAGLDFRGAYNECEESTYNGIPIKIVSKKDLIETKKRIDRKQDQIDVENLERK